MYTLLVIIIFLLIAVAAGSLYSKYKDKIHFIITGLDSGFSISDINMLWNTAQMCNLEEPISLFFSINELTKCMGQIQGQASATGTDKSPKIQLLMSKLFDYRTKIQNDSDDKKGLSTTQSLEKGQKLRIILPGKGVFYSEIVNNANFIVINVPKQKNLIPITGEEWVGKVISVYLWRKGDARYVFDTTVTQHGLFLGKSALFLKHSSNLVRTQKRKSVRAACEIYATLFIIKNNNLDIDAIETQNGYKCLLQDISESGALIRIGGKGLANAKIKIQFSIRNKLIIMSGVIKSVEYSEEENQSLLHFECTHIDPLMRNEILSYVYQMLPESEKEIIEALEQTELDSDNDPSALAETITVDDNIKETDESITAQAEENAQAAVSFGPDEENLPQEKKEPEKLEDDKSGEILPSMDDIKLTSDAEEDEIDVF